mgnify:CR=1 FL=1
MKEVKFNINGSVKVQLTEFGRKIVNESCGELQRWYDDNRALHNGPELKFEPPKEDKDGWSEWQFWKLMKTFGSHLDGLTGEVPFQTIIKLNVGKP